MLTSTTFPDLNVAARPIFVAFEEKDQSILSAASKSAASSSNNNNNGNDNGVGSQSSSSGTSDDDKGKTSLSGGAIAGIAIGALCAGILITCPLVFLLLRYCMGYRRISSDEKAAGRAVSQQAYYDGGQQHQGQVAAQQYQDQPIVQRAVSAKELPVGRPRAELDGREGGRP